MSARSWVTREPRCRSRSGVSSCSWPLRLTVWLALTWRKIPTYLVATPVLIAFLWMVFENGALTAAQPVVNERRYVSNDLGPADEDQTAVLTIDLTAARTQQPGPTVLSTRDVSAWFGTRKVLDSVSLDFARSQVTALIGPSGCGKSTYLRILNRMHELIPGAALAGEVLLDGADIYGTGQRPTDTRRRIGMVFQKPNPFPAMSIRDNVLSRSQAVRQVRRTTRTR